MDNVSKEERSRIMGLVKQQDTKPEMFIRSLLHRNGFRYRLHDKRLPGKPDLVFPKFKTILFVHGCFWHGHNKSSCKLARIPKSKIDFWTDKILQNRDRDTKNITSLEEKGWRVLIVWECELSDKELLKQLILDIKCCTTSL